MTIPHPAACAEVSCLCKLPVGSGSVQDCFLSWVDKPPFPHPPLVFCLLLSLPWSSYPSSAGLSLVCWHLSFIAKGSHMQFQINRGEFLAVHLSMGPVFRTGVHCWLLSNTVLKFTLRIPTHLNWVFFQNPTLLQLGISLQWEFPFRWECRKDFELMSGGCICSPFIWSKEHQW